MGGSDSGDLHVRCCHDGLLRFPPLEEETRQPWQEGCCVDGKFGGLDVDTGPDSLELAMCGNLNQLALLAFPDGCSLERCCCKLLADLHCDHCSVLWIERGQ